MGASGLGEAEFMSRTKSAVARNAVTSIPIRAIRFSVERVSMSAFRQDD
jgi:hypothetical protein